MESKGSLFRNTNLSSKSSQQIENILFAVQSNVEAAKSRSRLLDMIEQHAYDPARGLYIPLAQDVYLRGKAPNHSQLHQPIDFPCGAFPYPFFTNALTIPKGWGTDSFDAATAIQPKDRATNAGFLVVTIEFDGKSTGSLEEMLAWLRGESSDFKKSLFAKLDRKLGLYRDYRGFSAVFAGNRSVHFHFLFSTKHLLNAPWKATAAERIVNSQALIMSEAGRIAWDRCAELFQEEIGPSLLPDDKLRSITQWRRSPWAERKLGAASEVLGLAKGTVVPQLVIRENIRSRACRGSERWLISEGLNPVVPKTSSRASAFPFSSLAKDCRELVPLIQEITEAEWGAYPRPVAVEQLSDGDWIIRFRNHSADQKPSTIVQGGYHRLLLQGEHAFDFDLFLPDGRTANELCEFAKTKLNASRVGKVTSLQGLKKRMEEVRKAGGERQYQIREWERDFAECFEGSHEQHVGTLRERLGHVLHNARWEFSDVLIKSMEGAGKTTGHFDVVHWDSLDRAVAGPHERRDFGCFAFRSNEQAREKGKEYEASHPGRSAVEIRSVWKIYGSCCEKEGCEPLGEHDFHDFSLRARLSEIKKRQPNVFKRMEIHRKAVWGTDARLFNPGAAVVFTNHDLALGWDGNWSTRVWCHPEFDPMKDQDDGALRAQFNLFEAILDEPEYDKFLWVLPECLYRSLRQLKRQHPGWSRELRRERLGIYESASRFDQNLKSSSFEYVDELLRADLEQFEAVDVDFDAIPFGYDRNGRGIYKNHDGRRFYLGIRKWPEDRKTKLTFLTTEDVITRILEKVYDANRQSLRSISLRSDCGLFPIEVDTVCDSRAGKRNMHDLAKELLINPSAVVVGDMLGNDGDRIFTFQRMKGANGLVEKDIYVIPTNLSPNKYADLNILGQWLGEPRIISLFYLDQLNQAVGRNQGFRKSDKGSVTIVAPHRLKRLILNDCTQLPESRIRLSEVKLKKAS